MTKKKSPSIAAILNFLIPGTGYLYAKKRETFGWLVLFATIILAAHSYQRPYLIGDTLYVAGGLVLSFAFALDVHKIMNKK